MQQALVSLSLSLSHGFQSLQIVWIQKTSDVLPNQIRGKQAYQELIYIVSKRPMPQKINSDIGFEPMRTIRWVHSYLKEKQKFKQVRTTNLVFHACSAPFHARVH